VGERVPSISTQHGRDAGIVDLARGDPGRDLLPAALVREAAERATAACDPDLLQYGHEAGDANLRAAIAALLEREGAGTCDPERLFVTAGASLALHLVLTLFVEPGDRVLVDAATYHLALAQFRDHRLWVEAVPGDAGGMHPAALEDALRAGPAALLYLVPAFANPTGVTLAPERQRELVAVAERHGLRIVADEVYRLTGFSDPSSHGTVPPSLAAVSEGHVLGLNSVSKILSPGLRLGWIEGPGRDLERLTGSGVLRSGGGMNPFTGAVVREAIESGALSLHIARLRGQLRERHEALAGALRSELPEADFATASGGYFLWLRLPGVDPAGERARAALRRHGVRVAPGALFAAASTDDTGGGGERERMRLCFAHHHPAALRDGAARLAAAAAELRR
jgi:2-aminoadipate transaminase